MKRMHLLIVLAVVAGSLIFTADLAAKVVRVRAVVSPTAYSGKCPKRFEFTGKITVNRAGVVKYRWIRSDGATAPVKTIRFLKRGSRKVASYWQIGAQGKHWKAIRILAPNKMTSNRAIFKLRCGRRPGLIERDRTIRPVQVRPGVIVARNCADPAAHELRFDIVRRDSQFKGRIRITGIVKNIGGKAFVSDPKQAGIYLYELPAGVPPASATTGKIVAQRQIASLPAGAMMSLTYERNWNSSSPAEGEFPNSYRLLITYDPDIYMDANKQNDDCKQGNNKKDRSGTEINDMLR